MSTRNRELALDVLSRISGRQRPEIREDMDLVADLGIDSPKALELLLELEEALGVEISDEEASGMETVRDVLAYAERVG
jgi:acyl carrier protein